jgi:hypothetical protein
LYRHDKFAGIVYLHPIMAAAGPAATARDMRLFKRLCGSDQLKNVVVVTTRWDEICHSEEEPATIENLEHDLLEHESLLRELSVAGVPFFRAGHFSDGAPQPAGDQYQSPLAVVERLLGLEPVYLQIQQEMAEGKLIQETTVGLHAELEFERLKKDLNEITDKVLKAWELLEIAHIEKAELEKQNEHLQMLLPEWEELQRRFSAERKTWEGHQVRCRPSLAGVDSPIPARPSSYMSAS